jgi:hypothetical protein
LGFPARLTVAAARLEVEANQLSVHQELAGGLFYGVWPPARNNRIYWNRAMLIRSSAAAINRNDYSRNAQMAANLIRSHGTRAEGTLILPGLETGQIRSCIDRSF